MSFVCFILSAEFGVSDVPLPSWFRVLRDKGRLCANEVVLVPLSRKMKADIMDLGLLKMISDCEVDPAAVLLALTRANEVNWTDLEVL